MRQLSYLLFSLVALGIMACGGNPNAGFDMKKSGDLAPVTVTFTNTSQGADRYMWDFGDGNNSEEENPTHTFDYWGEYTIKLLAIKGGQETISTQQISIKEPLRRKAIIETNYGNMTVELSNLTPKHRDNFIKLAEAGYYNDLLFHRVINGFMLQGGDPDSRGAGLDKQLGMGGPGYRVDAEFRKGLYHYKGALAAARDGNPQKASSGSQFYIVHGSGPISNLGQLSQIESNKNFSYTAEERAYYQQNGGTPQLDNDYTVFGYVIEGFDVIDKIASVPTANADRPYQDIVMRVSMLN